MSAPAEEQTPVPPLIVVLDCFYAGDKNGRKMRHYFRSVTGVTGRSSRTVTFSDSEPVKKAVTFSNSKPVKEKSFASFPLEIRKNIYKYLLPDEERKISLSERLSTSEAFPEGYFAKLEEVRGPIEAAMKTCKLLCMELNLLFWAKYKFHITLFVKSTHSPCIL